MRKLTWYIPEQSVLWGLLFFSLGLQAKTLNVQCAVAEAGMIRQRFLLLSNCSIQACPTR